MAKFAVHYFDGQGANRLWIIEAIDPEHAKQLFNANVGKFRIGKIKVLRS